MTNLTSVLLCLPLAISVNVTSYKVNIFRPNNKRVFADSYREDFLNSMNRLKQNYDNNVVNEISKSLVEQYKEKEEEKRIIDDKIAEESKYIVKTFTITFYTDLNSENGYGSVNSRGEKLIEGMVANNVYPIGTEIDLGNMGIVRVADRGGRVFNNDGRLDMLIPRNSGESNSDYYKRVNRMGKRVVTGKILKASMNNH